MRCNLRCRLMILFVVVSICALSGAMVVRSLIVRDFKHYMDGEAQDRIQRVIAQLEGNYDLHGGWKRDAIAKELAWVLQIGFEARLHDHTGSELLQTESALELLSPLMRKRVLETSDYGEETASGAYISYPLFLKGNEIGQIDLRQLRPVKEEFFIASSNRFLMFSLLGLGIVSLVISVIASRRLTQPIQELTEASSDIASGNLTRRAKVFGNDELGQMAIRFNQMAETIESQEKLRRRLLSGAAHELRTPLAIISGELEGMIDGVLPLNKEALISMHEESIRLTAILNGIDEITCAESARVQLQYQTFPLKGFLQTIVARFDTLFSDKNSALLLDCPENLLISADPDRLSQIIINLVSNALKAIGHTGRVSLVATEDIDGVSLMISDNGCGVSAADLPHIFERFYKGKGKGLGIGLSIVQELVVAHGWHIQVRSRPGETVFTVEIPNSFPC